jgi:hypothetical protein
VIDVSLEKALPGFTLSVAWAAQARVVALFGAPHDAGTIARDFRRIAAAA